MKFKMPKFLKLPVLPKFPKRFALPKLNVEPVKKFVLLIYKHKILITSFVIFIVFISAALWYRGYLLSKMKTVSDNTGVDDFYSAKSENPLPSIASPTPSGTPDTNSVLGTSTYNKNLNNSAPMTISTPFPTFAPLPTVMPVPTPTIVIPAVTNNSSSGNNSSNPNCTTGSGTPNTWYSDVYPNPPITTNTGSVTLIVDIRDCNKNLAPVSDTISVSLNSGDPNTLVNGNKLPTTVTTQNGEVKFSVSSQISGSVTLVVQDTTGNFTVTDINNHNPSITFTNTGSGTSGGNSNCSTASGVANSWYSDVYPASPVTANTGSTVTFTVKIRDCNQNMVSSDSITISQTSNDLGLTINGSSPPATIQVQNGQATFTVTSQNAGTDTLKVQDTTSNFTVTDTGNNNPSIIFSGSSTSNPTPIPSASPTSSPTGSPTPTPSASPTSSPTGSPTPTP